MKLLSIGVPCYNSEAYMERAINTLLKGGEDVEIIIVNDGSKDGTIDIANRYYNEYPNIIKIVDKENGGHGSAVNAALEVATGLYFKIVDSDDWVDTEALNIILTRIKQLESYGIDLFVSNYVYEKLDKEKKKSINYHGALPVEKIFTWDDIIRFRPSQNIIMHSVIYRTQLLRDIALELPKHTFYVDNIFVFVPLPYVKNIYYVDVDLYRYFIGREDQSVNEKVMISRVDQQLKVNKILIEAHDIANIESKKLRNYMTKYITMMLLISSILLIKEGSDASLIKKVELWEYLKEKDKWLFKKVKRSILGNTARRSDVVSHKIVETGYSISRKIYGFN